MGPAQVRCTHQMMYQFSDKFSQHRSNRLRHFRVRIFFFFFGVWDSNLDFMHFPLFRIGVFFFCNYAALFRSLRFAASTWLVWVPIASNDEFFYPSIELFCGEKSINISICEHHYKYMVEQSAIDIFYSRRPNIAAVESLTAIHNEYLRTDELNDFLSFSWCDASSLTIRRSQ